MAEEQLYRKLAKYYDKIYSQKDYEKEVDFIISVLEKCGVKGREILDVACGTGTHAKLLKERGYSVTGLDKNPEMLKIARRKVKDAKFIKDDMREFDLKERFDSIICLFTSMNYSTTLEDLERTLRNFYKHLERGGVVIFDLGLTKLKEFPIRIDTYTEKGLQIARISQMQPLSNRTVESKFLIFIKGKEKLDFEIDEHILGVFDPAEVRRIMKSIGFDVNVYDNFSFKKYTRKSKRPVFVGIKKK